VTIGRNYLLVGCCYRPPSQNATDRDNFLSLLDDSIHNIQDLCVNHSIFMLGDFNDQCASWKTDHDQSELGISLRDLAFRKNLHQLIHEPTRYSDNAGYIIDLILTDSPVLVCEVGVASPLANLDHCTIFCKLLFTFTKMHAYTRQTWDYKSADFTALNDALTSAPWDTAYTIFDDIDDLQMYWETLFLLV
jgi:hypothetical protein